MSHNTAIYQITRLERQVAATTTWSLACGYCEAKVEGTEPGGILAVTLARELHLKGWTFRDGAGEKVRCPVCKDVEPDAPVDPT